MENTQFEQCNLDITKEVMHQNDVINKGDSENKTHQNMVNRISEEQIFQENIIFNSIPYLEKTSKKSLECNICYKTLSSKTNLSRHIQQVHNGVKLFQCDTCFLTFAQKSNLKRHLITHEKVSPKLNNTDINQHIRTSNNYQCLYCDDEFSSAHNLKKHEKKYHQDHLFTNEKQSTKLNNPVIDVQIRTSNNYQCLYCDEEFISAHNLKKHEKKYHQDHLFYNDKQSPKLNSHVIDVQIETFNKYQCLECDKEFSSPRNLRKHVDKSHQDQKLHECDVCHKQFAKKKHLKAHLHVHTGEKPFACNKSPMKFSQRDSMKKHKSLHVVNHSQKQLFTCVICQKKLPKKDALKDHLWLHNEEKPFSCDKCPIRFTLRETMMAHKKLHMWNYFGNRSFAT